MTAPYVRAEVRYTGRVQGVGFRWRAAMTAGSHGVTGHVRNVHDGSVELVAEGTRPAVEQQQRARPAFAQAGRARVSIPYCRPAGKPADPYPPGPWTQVAGRARDHSWCTGTEHAEVHP